MDLMIYLLAADLDAEAAVGVLFESVFDEVEKHLGPVEAIALHDEVRVWHGDGHFGVLVADDGFEPLEDVFDAGAEFKRFELEGVCLAGFEAGNDEHVLDDAGDAVSVLAHDGEKPTGHFWLVDHVVVDEVFQIAVDDGERGAELVGRISDEVLADLFGLVLGGHVADHDTGGGTAWAVKLSGVDDPSVDATVFEVATWRCLLGEDDAGLSRFTGGEALEEGVCEAGVEEGFTNGAVAELTLAEEGAGCLVCEADICLGVHEEEGVAEGVEEEIPFIPRLFEVAVEPEFPVIDFCVRAAADGTVAVAEDDESGEGDERDAGGDDGDV